MKRLAVMFVFTFVACTPPPQELRPLVDNSPPPAPVVIAPADPMEYAPFLRSGDGTVSGQVFARTRGGDVRLGAGNNIYLDPLTTYARDFWRTKRYADDLDSPSSDPLFMRARRTAIVGAQGQFKFAGLTPGWYFLHSKVTWEAGSPLSMQGGLVGDSVLVRPGTPVEVMLVR